MKFYCIVVDHRIWGDLPVSKDNHYEVYAFDSEKAMRDHIWDMQINTAESYGGWDEDEEDSEWVENNSDYRVEEYDPNNLKHVECPGLEDLRKQFFGQDHFDAVIAAEKAKEIDWIKTQIDRKADELNKVKAELEALIAKLEAAGGKYE